MDADKSCYLIRVYLRSSAAHYFIGSESLSLSASVLLQVLNRCFEQAHSVGRVVNS